jgi:hypothetical protein
MRAWGESERAGVGGAPPRGGAISPERGHWPAGREAGQVARGSCADSDAACVGSQCQRGASERRRGRRGSGAVGVGALWMGRSDGRLRQARGREANNDAGRRCG